MGLKEKGSHHFPCASSSTSSQLGTISVDVSSCEGNETIQRQLPDLASRTGGPSGETGQGGPSGETGQSIFMQLSPISPAPPTTPVSPALVTPIYLTLNTTQNTTPRK